MARRITTRLATPVVVMAMVAQWASAGELRVLTYTSDLLIPAEVEIWPVDGDQTEQGVSATAGPDGARFDLLDGAYQVLAEAEGFARQRKVVHVGPESQTIRMGLEVGDVGQGPPRRFALRGRILDHRGRDLWYRVLPVVANDTNRILNRRVRDDGSFSFSVLERTKTYVFLVFASGDEPGEAPRLLYRELITPDGVVNREIRIDDGS